MVERDVADVTPVRKPDALHILIDQMAVRSAQGINISELAKRTKLRRITVEKYLDILIRLSMLTKLGAWTSGEGKREIKNPKYHLADSGNVCALRRFLDGLLESFVLNELLRAVQMQAADYRLSHWRSADQREIDILIDGCRPSGLCRDQSVCIGQ